MARLDSGVPVGALVNLKYFGGSDSGHFVVITGYGARGFWLHDPNNPAGANVYLDRNVLDAALREVTGFANAPYQGIVVN